MTGHEDDIPSSHVEHFRSADTEPPPALQEAPTLPPPPVDEALAAAVAAHVISALAPQIRRVEELAMGLRTWIQNAEPRLNAFDRGISSALQLFTETAANVERIADALGPRTENQPPLFDAVRQLDAKIDGAALDVDAIRTYLLGRGATVHELQRAEERKQPATSSTDRPGSR